MSKADIISASELIEQIKEWKSKSRNDNVPIKLVATSIDGKFFFEFCYDYDSNEQFAFKITNDAELRPRLLDILDRIGVVNLHTQFIARTIDSKVGLLRRYKRDWFGWFINAITSLNKESYILIPDTNLIKRHYISRIFFPIHKDGELPLIIGRELPEIVFKIPRLVVLELEAQLKNKSPRNYSDWYELLYMMRNGAELLPELEPETIRAFSKIAGEGFADAWIRREIREYASKSSPPIFLSPETKGRYGILFLTCDVGNALASVAESIPTLLLSKTSQEEYTLGEPEEIADLIIETSINFANIKLEKYLGKDKEIFSLKGDWSGKTILDWENNSLQLLSE